MPGRGAWAGARRPGRPQEQMLAVIGRFALPFLLSSCSEGCPRESWSDVNLSPEGAWGREAHPVGLWAGTAITPGAHGRQWGEAATGARHIHGEGSIPIFQSFGESQCSRLPPEGGSG